MKLNIYIFSEEVFLAKTSATLYLILREKQLNIRKINVTLFSHALLSIIAAKDLYNAYVI